MKNPSRTWTICSGCTSFLIVNQDYPSSLRTTTPAGVYRAQPPQAALSASSAVDYHPRHCEPVPQHWCGNLPPDKRGSRCKKKIPTAVRALPRNDEKGCHCEPLRPQACTERNRQRRLLARVVPQTTTFVIANQCRSTGVAIFSRTTGAAGAKRRFPRQCAHCLGMTKRGVSLPLYIFFWSPSRPGCAAPLCFCPEWPVPGRRAPGRPL